MMLLLLATLLAPVAQADDDTYCVGGYSGRPPFAAMRCGSRAIARMHPRWHFHMWVRRGNECFACFDEVDNSCESHFLRDHPRFRAVRDPLSECPQADTMDEVVIHLIHGRDVTPQPPPPPPPPQPKPDAGQPGRPPNPDPSQPSRPATDPGRPANTDPGRPVHNTPGRPANTDPGAPASAPASPEPVELRARLDSVPAGPHQAGDTVPLVASVRDGAGDIRGVPGGTFVITADGTESRLPGVVQPDGTVRADLVLPAASNVEIRFEADPPRLASHERLVAAASAARTLQVETCTWRAHLTEPTPGASAAVGQPLTLVAVLRDASGQTASPPDVSLSFTLSPPASDQLSIQAGPDGRATWIPEPALVDQEVSVVASGRAGVHHICPVAPLTLRVSALGLGLDTSGLPEHCYAGLDCSGAARLLRPSAQGVRQQVDALLADPTTRVLLYDNVELVAELPPSPDDQYRFQRRYDVVHQANWRIELRSATTTLELGPHVVDVRAPLVVDLDAELDLGSVVAGTSWEETCKTLDFGRSTSFLDHRWSIEVAGLEGCTAEPVLAFRNVLGLADHVRLTSPATIEKLDPLRPMLDVCLLTSGCAGEAAPDDVRLVIKPLTPEFADQHKEIRLRWTVLGRGVWECHGWWIASLAGGFTLALLAWGFIRPHRFPAHAAIRVAGTPQALKRTSAVLLVDLPGSGAGWYRDARLGVQGDGSLSGKLWGARAVLRATRNGVLITGQGLEQQDRRSGAWKAVEDAATGHAPQAGAIYRVGEVLFSLEGT